MENESVVTQDAGSAPVETNSEPTTSTTQDTGGGGTQQASGRSYTEDQVQAMIRGRIAQANKSWEKRLSEYQSKQQQYEQAVQRMNSGIEAMGRGFGFIQDQQADPVSEKLSALEKQMEEKLNQRFQKQEEDRLYNSIQNDWKAVSAKYADWADLPGFKDAWAKSWAPDADPAALAAKLVEAYEKKFAARSNQAAAVKEGRLKSAPVKAGGGTVAGSKSDEKIPLRKHILAALQGGD